MNIDWFPTLLDLCGLDASGIDVDGVGIVPLIRDGAEASPHDVLHFDFERQWAVRRGDWKLICNAIDVLPNDRNKTLEGLYLTNLKIDRTESENLIDRYPEKAQELLALAGKTERELVAEMPLIIKITAVGPRIFVADGYEPSKELIDLVKNHAPEKDADSEHTYGWHRIFNQNCRWRGLRYGTCKDCFGIEFDLCQGNHSYKDGSCTVCGRSKPGEEPEHVHSFTPWTALDDGMHHGRECACGYAEMGEHNMETERIQYPNKVVIIERCTICGLEYRSEMA